MFVDLEEKSVTFTGSTTLTLEQLYSLIDLMDDGFDDEPDLLGWADEVQPQDWLPGWVLPRRIWTVESSNGAKFYATVHLEDETWACSCPNWIYRLSGEGGGNCKHILRVIWLS